MQPMQGGQPWGPRGVLRVPASSLGWRHLTSGTCHPTLLCWTRAMAGCLLSPHPTMGLHALKQSTLHPLPPLAGPSAAQE